MGDRWAIWAEIWPGRCRAAGLCGGERERGQDRERGHLYQGSD
jgi:hypothetical protein